MPIDQQVEIRNFIDGKLTPPASGEYFDNIEPATGKVYSKIPESNDADLDQAVKAAQKAFPAWRDTPVNERAACLEKLADLIDASKEAFIAAESRDNGKPVGLTSTVDIPRGTFNFRAFAKSMREFSDRDFKKENTESYILRSPIGVVATISPWNLPLLLFTWKIAPALVTGNCVIAKPSEVTPMTAYMLSELVNEAGFPPGVLNILHGHGAQIGAAMTSHPDIAAVSFTGGTQTGMAIYKAAANQLKKVSLELGGKNPTIVFDDADFDKTVEGAKAAAFTNQGQICLCGSRLFVHESIYERFKEALVQKTSEIKIGNPANTDTQHGAMVSEDHMKKVLSYIDLAKEEGGKILIGGKRCIMDGECKDGFFIEPTIIEGLPYTCRTNQEEIFGPVVSIIPFKDEAEVIEMANSTQYGLAASVWTQDQEKAARVAAKLESGVVWINSWNLRDLDTPFGGMKKSGLGREGTWDALHFFTQQKTVTKPA